MKFNSIKFEITFLYTLILGVSLLIFSGVVYVILSHTIYTELDNELRIKAEEIRQTIRSYLEVHGEDQKSLQFAAEKTIAHEGKHLRGWWILGFERRWFKQLDKLDLSEEYVHLLTTDGESVVHSKNVLPPLLEAFLGHTEIEEQNVPYYYNFTLGQKQIRAVNYLVSYDEGLKYILQVGVSQQPITQLLQSWLHAMVMVIPVLLFLVFIVGWMLSRRFLQPIQAMTATAEKITHSDLSSRVEAPHAYQETKRLADAFNEMISRLEKAFHHIEEFSAHVAHELKTPLTIIRGETELALLSEKRSPQDYRQAMQVNMEETEKMLRIIDDLLLLTKLDYQPEIFQFASIEFNTFLRDIFEQSKILASARSLRIELDMPSRKMMTRADSLHLRRLFLNIMDNAIKHSPPQGQIVVRCRPSGKTIVTEILDSGPGIPPEACERIFERFFQVQDGPSAGAGLGLSIAQSIARIHQGRIEVESIVHKGTTFRIFLPLLHISPLRLSFALAR